MNTLKISFFPYLYVSWLAPNYLTLSFLKPFLCVLIQQHSVSTFCNASIGIQKRIKTHPCFQELPSKERNKHEYQNYNIMGKVVKGVKIKSGKKYITIDIIRRKGCNIGNVMLIKLIELLGERSPRKIVGDIQKSRKIQELHFHSAYSYYLQLSPEDNGFSFSFAFKSLVRSSQRGILNKNFASQIAWEMLFPGL